MIAPWRTSLCFVLRRAEDGAPYDEEFDAHYDDELDAQRGLSELRAYDDAAPQLVAHRLDVICLSVTCDGCRDEYEDPDRGGRIHWSDIDTIVDLLDGNTDEWKAQRDGRVLCPPCREAAAAEGDDEPFDCIGQDVLLAVDDQGALQ